MFTYLALLVNNLGNTSQPYQGVHQFHRSTTRLFYYTDCSYQKNVITYSYPQQLVEMFLSATLLPTVCLHPVWPLPYTLCYSLKTFRKSTRICRYSRRT